MKRHVRKPAHLYKKWASVENGYMKAEDCEPPLQRSRRQRLTCGPEARLSSLWKTLRYSGIVSDIIDDFSFCGYLGQ